MKSAKHTEQEYRDLMYGKAKDVKTPKDFDNLCTEIFNYQHDYGTIVVGCSAAMKAAFNLINGSPNGGITGFQASCVGWEMIKEFFLYSGPARLVKYEEMLYPQYNYQFQKTIDKDTWEYLQNKAKENLKDNTKSTHPEVVAHWRSIADGTVPFGYSVAEEK